MLVALMFTVLMGFAALSIDVGRFYSERRFMQDAVDSAALACAYKYAQGGVIADAWAAGDNVLQLRNLKGNPLGLGCRTRRRRVRGAWLRGVRPDRRGA